MIAEELPTVSVLVCQRDLSGHVQKSTITSHWKYQNGYSSIIFCVYRSCFNTWGCFRKIISVSWLVGNCKQKAATSAEPTSWRVSHLSQHCLFWECNNRILLHDIFCYAFRFWWLVLIIPNIMFAKTGCQWRKQNQMSLFKQRAYSMMHPHLRNINQSSQFVYTCTIARHHNSRLTGFYSVKPSSHGKILK